MEKVSVIVPIYNVEKYIDECIESIVCQTYTDTEIILIDDGSTDSSLARCEQWANKDNRIKILTQTNAGPSTARNKGLSHATGTYIIFVDADDTLCSTCIAEAVQAVQGVDIAFWGATLFYADGHKNDYIPTEAHTNNREETERALLHLKTNSQNFPHFGYTWNKIFRRNIIEDNNTRFPEDLRVYEDELFTSDYTKSVSSLQVVPHALYRYRVVGSSLTHQCKSKATYLRLFSAIAERMHQYKYDKLIAYERGHAASLLVDAGHTASSLREAVRIFAQVRKFTIKKETIAIRRNQMIFHLPTPLAFAVYLIDRLLHKI